MWSSIVSAGKEGRRSQFSFHQPPLKCSCSPSFPLTFHISTGVYSKKVLLVFFFLIIFQFCSVWFQFFDLNKITNFNSDYDSVSSL